MTSTVICNLALRHLKVAKEIADLETEQSSEAAVCRAFYDTIRSDTLRRFAWPFAAKQITLSLIEETPTDEWDFSYRYPTDCVMLKRILSGERNDTRQTRVPYLIGADDTGTLIYTDMQDAVAAYTFLNQSEQTYPPDFILALSFNLAQHLSPSLLGGDPFKLGDRANKMLMETLMTAEANAANEEQADELTESEFILARA